MDHENERELAAAALIELEKLHMKFMKTVASLATKKVDGGHIGVSDNELFAECLGITLSAHHRAVARKGRLMALEYAFEARDKNDDLLVWSMYLEADGTIYADSRIEDRVCSTENAYMPRHVVSRLASALLRSKLFAPNN